MSSSGESGSYAGRSTATSQSILSPDAAPFIPKKHRASAAASELEPVPVLAHSPSPSPSPGDSSASGESANSRGSAAKSSIQPNFNASPFVPKNRRRDQKPAAAASSSRGQQPQPIPNIADFPSLGDSISACQKKLLNNTLLPSTIQHGVFDLSATLDGIEAEHDGASNKMAKDARAALEKEDDPFKRKCLQLLLTHDKRGNRSFYQNRAFEMIPSNCYTFKIDFIHFLQPEYLDLGIKVWEEYQATTTLGFLRTTVVDFLKIHCVFKNEGQVVSVDLDCDNLPIVMQPFTQYKAEQLVRKDDSELGRSNNLVSTTFLGRQILISALKLPHENHLARTTWGGKFSAKNIYIIEFSRNKIWCQIQAESIAFSDENLALDVKQIHNSMVGSYEISGSFPVHFECLAADIKGFTAASVTRTSFLSYFPYHVAVMPHGANKSFTEELHNVTEGVWMHPEDFKVYYSIFEVEPNDPSDWRHEFASSSDPLIKGVYTHDSNLGQIQVQKTEEDLTQRQYTQETVVQPQQDQVAAVQLQQDQVAAVQPQQTSEQVQETTAGRKWSKFRRTLKGKLTFKRQMNVHLFNHMAGRRPLRGLYQSEVYAAKKNRVLGEIFSELYKNKPMNLEAHLFPMLANYRGTRDVDDESVVR